MTNPDLNLNADIMEWDGTTVTSSSGGFQTYTSGTGLQNVVFTTGSANSPLNPPSDVVGNISMRRLRLRFERVTGTIEIWYDATANQSRLETGTVVPEKSLVLGLVIPFLPPVMYRMMRRRRKKSAMLSFRYSNSEYKNQEKIRSREGG